ncbi:MAG: molybdopterin-dependent oxidoreductase, partial [Polyangia bacterium]
FGTALTDDFFPVRPGGDIAFFSGVLKSLDEQGGWDDAYIAERTVGAGELRAHLKTLDWDELVKESGIEKSELERFATLYKNAKRTVLLYSMGLTQYTFGVENVKMVVNVALARGNLGREKCGIIPIRGHSGVQGTAECGVDSDKLPGSQEINEESCARFEKAWGHPIPHRKGLKAAHALDAAADGKMDFLYLVGGNFLETMPDPDNARQGLSRPKVRIHQDIVLNTSTLVDAGERVLVLPAQTRYESGGTSTSTERRIRYSPKIVDPEGARIPEAKAEWEIPALIGRALLGEKENGAFAWQSTDEIRAEMGALMPMYQGIETLKAEGEFVQWGGARLGQNGFPNMPEGRAVFTPLALPATAIPDGKFRLATRRGKQFNSITYGAYDPITGSTSRADVLFAKADLAALGLKDGDPIKLRSDLGEMRAIAKSGPCRRRHIQAFWPESNVLIGRRYDPASGEPDYNALVEVERA